jgi:hypothetical protein
LAALRPVDDQIERSNPYHDERGRFTTAEGWERGRCRSPTSRASKNPPRSRNRSLQCRRGKNTILPHGKAARMLTSGKASRRWNRQRPSRIMAMAKNRQAASSRPLPATARRIGRCRLEEL